MGSERRLLIMSGVQQILWSFPSQAPLQVLRNPSMQLVHEVPRLRARIPRHVRESLCALLINLSKAEAAVRQRVREHLLRYI